MFHFADSLLKRLAWHSQTNNLLSKCIHLAYGSSVESIHNVVCRIKAIFANHHHGSLVGETLGEVAALPMSHALFLHTIATNAQFLFVNLTGCASL